VGLLSKTYQAIAASSHTAAIHEYWFWIDSNPCPVWQAAQSQAQHEALACQLREENEALQAHLAVTNGEQAELQTEMAALRQALAQASAQSQVSARLVTCYQNQNVAVTYC